MTPMSASSWLKSSASTGIHKLSELVRKYYGIYWASIWQQWSLGIRFDEQQMLIYSQY